ncbi:MAG: hypothetical protein LUQ71_10745, partial [Methanoregula sp.]|nr:hypothetical protein [Methanoregula sp.]
MKFFEKSTTTKDQKGKQKTEKAQQKPAKPDVQKPANTKGGLGTHLKSIISSFGSLGTILKEKGKRGKKVDDINKMLDKTVSEKVAKPSQPSGIQAVAAGTGGSFPAPGGAGSLDDTDPFVSLSDDEFDAGLLEGLDDDNDLSLSSGSEPVTGSEPSPDLPVPELSVPSLDSMAEASGASDAGSGGLDEFSGLDDNSAMDAEFGDLDNLSLDDVDMDEDMDGGSSAEASPEAAHSGAPASPVTASGGAESNAVKTAWIASDAPPGADMTEDQIGIQADMASFSGGSGGTDEDLLSSIASDVKTIKKESDLSLLRELKDFKAPATDIEDELKGLYQKIGGISKEKEKDPTSADGMK